MVGEWLFFGRRLFFVCEVFEGAITLLATGKMPVLLGVLLGMLLGQDLSTLPW